MSNNVMMLRDKVLVSRVTAKAVDTKYRFLRVSCQSYKNSECDSRENQPMIGGQTFLNSYEVSDWLFFT